MSPYALDWVERLSYVASMADHSLNLGTEALVAFVATTDLVRAREFYVETLGLRFADPDGNVLSLTQMEVRL